MTMGLPHVDPAAFDAETFDAVAACFEYPGPSAAAGQRRAAGRVRAFAPALAAALEDLAEWLEADLERGRERYTALFDLNPTATLDLGYHIFGEDYRRGELLAGLRAEQQKAGLATGGELPDHLTCLLRLLPRLPGPEDAEALVEVLLLPAMKRIATALAEDDGRYAAALRALPSLLGLAPAAAAGAHGPGAALGNTDTPHDDASCGEAASHV